MCAGAWRTRSRRCRCGCYRRTARAVCRRATTRVRCSCCRARRRARRGVDLVSQLVTHLCVYGNGYVGKYRSEGKIVQLGLLHPDSVQVELTRPADRLHARIGRTEHGPEDVLHVKAMSMDGLRG